MTSTTGKDFLLQVARRISKAVSKAMSPYVPAGTPAFQQGYTGYGPNPHAKGSIEHADWNAGADRHFLDHAI